MLESEVWKTVRRKFSTSHSAKSAEELASINYGPLTYRMFSLPGFKCYHMVSYMVKQSYLYTQPSRFISVWSENFQ